MAFEIWALLILKIVGVIIGGHLAVTKLLPELKKMLSLFVKKEELITSVISILIFYVAVLVFKFIVSFLAAVENKYLGYANVLLPGIEVILVVTPFVLTFLAATVVVAGLTNVTPKK
jgi:hypothetical protein